MPGISTMRHSLQKSPDLIKSLGSNFETRRTKFCQDSEAVAHRVVSEDVEMKDNPH